MSSAFGTFGLLLPRFASFPYQAWELLPCGPGKSKFSITAMTGIVEIGIEVSS